MCCEACCEARCVVCEWEGISKVGGSEWTECGRISVRADVLLDVVVVGVIMVETVDVVQVWLFIFFRDGCLGDMMDVRVVMEVVMGVGVLVGVVVLVWWRCSVV